MQDSDLTFYYPLNRTNTSAHGGRMSGNAINSAALQNVFKHVFKAIRDAGDEPDGDQQKLFCKVADDSDGTLYSPAFCIDGTTLGDDWCFMWAGTQRDTRADITGSERIYGGGLTTTAITAGSSLTVTVELKSTQMQDCIQAGDTVRITDKSTPDSSSGNVEWATVSGTPSLSGTLLTITLADYTANSYAIGSKISSLYHPSDIATSTESLTVTSSAGTFDDTTYPIVLDNIGTTDEDITVTFTDATHFTVTGDSLGTIGSGDTSTNFTATNSVFSKPRFTISAAGWGGTFVAGDTMTFTIHPSAVPIWEQKVTPAGATSMSNNRVTLVWSGESLT